MVVGTYLRQGGQRGLLCDLKLELTLQMLVRVKGQGAEGMLGRRQGLDPGGLGYQVQSELLLRTVILVAGAGARWGRDGNQDTRLQRLTDSLLCALF